MGLSGRADSSDRRKKALFVTGSLTDEEQPVLLKPHSLIWLVPGQGATQCLSKYRADSAAITLKIRSTAGPARQQTNKMTECFSYTNSSFMQAPLRYMGLSLLKYQTPSDEMGMLHPTTHSYKTDNKARVTSSTITLHNEASQAEWGLLWSRAHKKGTSAHNWEARVETMEKM